MNLLKKFFQAICNRNKNDKDERSTAEAVQELKDLRAQIREVENALINYTEDRRYKPYKLLKQKRDELLALHESKVREFNSRNNHP